MVRRHLAALGLVLAVRVAAEEVVYDDEYAFRFAFAASTAGRVEEMMMDRWGTATIVQNAFVNDLVWSAADYEFWALRQSAFADWNPTTSSNDSALLESTGESPLAYVLTELYSNVTAMRGLQVLVQQSLNAAFYGNGLKRLLHALVRRGEASLTMAYVGFVDGTWLGFYQWDEQFESNDMALALDVTVVDTLANHTVGQCEHTPEGNETVFCPHCCREDWETTYDGYQDGPSFKGPTYYDCRERPWFRDRLEDGSRLKGWTRPYVFTGSQEIGTTASQTIWDKHGIRVGVMGMDVSFEYLNNFLLNAAKVENIKDATLFIYDNMHSNHVIASTSGSLLDYGPDGSASLVSPDKSGVRAIERAYRAINDADVDFLHGLAIFEHWFVYLTPIKDTVADGLNWTLVTTYPVGCPAGMREDLVQGCTDCDGTLWSGAESISCNQCAVGYYDKRTLQEIDDHAAPECAECETHAVCDKPNTLLSSLPLERGYMRMAERSTDILECRVRDACPGGYFGVGPNSCQSGFGGAYCDLCVSGFFDSPDRQSCRRCTGKKLKLPGTIVLLFFYGAGAVGCLYVLFRMVRGTKETDAEVAEANTLVRLRCKLRNKWKLCFVSVQIAAMTPQIVPSRMISAYYEDVLNAFGVIAFQASFPARNCFGVGRITFHDQLVASTAGPFLLAAYLVAFGWYLDGGVGFSGPAYLSSLEVVLLLFYIVLPGISNTVIQAFYCTKHLDGGKQYYVADLLLACKGRRHRLATIYAAECIAIFVVGIPACFFLVLWRRRRKLDPRVATEEDDDGARPALRKARRYETDYDEVLAKVNEQRTADPEAREVQILWMPYVPAYWYYEIIELARRLFTTSFVVVVTHQPAFRIFLALLATLVCVKLQITCEPFHEANDNFLAESLLTLVLAYYLCLICLLCDIVKNTTALFVILIGLFMFTIVLTIYTVVHDIHRERAALNELAEDVQEAVMKDSQRVFASMQRGVEATLDGDALVEGARSTLVRMKSFGGSMTTFGVLPKTEPRADDEATTATETPESRAQQELTVFVASEVGDKQECTPAVSCFCSSHGDSV